MKNTKKLAALVLLLAFIILLCACENVYMPSQSAADRETVSQVIDKIAEQLPDNDEYKGAVLTVATSHPECFKSSESSSGIIPVAVRDRNAMLKSKYGLEVKMLPVKEANVAKEIQAAVSSGTGYADILCYTAKTTALLYASGLLSDIASLPLFSLNSELCDTELAYSLQTGNYLYAIPDVSALYYDDIYTVFYDKQLIESCNMESPETLVRQGKWTWDALYSHVKVFAADTLAKQSPDSARDTFGFSGFYNEDVLPYVMWASAGVDIIENGNKKMPEVMNDTNTLSAVVEKYTSIYSSNALLPQEGDYALDAFAKGRLGFLIYRLDYLKELRGGEYGREIGFVPLPKYSVSQKEYSSLADMGARLLSVPVNPTDEKLAGLSLSAVIAAGESIIKPAAVNSYVYNYLHNNEETLMLEEIIKSAYFDLAYLFSDAVKEMKTVSVTAITEAMTLGSSVKTNVYYGRYAFNKYAQENFAENIDNSVVS